MSRPAPTGGRAFPGAIPFAAMLAEKNVIGHAMFNDPPYFKDLRGWKNHRSDWLAVDVREFRSRL